MAQLASKFFSLFISKPTGPADTPEGFLHLARKCVERVRKMTSASASGLKFNHGQCRYLAKKLNLAVESAHYFLEVVVTQQVRSQEDTVDCLEIFMRLYALAMEVENIIRSCCTDAWTLAAVTLADVSEHISSIGLNLELWRVAFYGRMTPAAVDYMFLCEVEVVKEQASIDKETLLRDIHGLLQKRKLSSTESERGSLLLERLERSMLTPTGDSSRSSQSRVSENVMSSLKQMESLGKGSASTVYKVVWLGAEFAKKTFYCPNFPDFEKEVSILTGLSHPNIAPLICHAKDHRECSIVMELMDEDLFGLMQRRLKVDKARDSPFSILEAVDIMHQLGEGMHYLHEMKIVHRDLKSMNVLVKCLKTPESEVEYVQVKVADFGMSRTKERSMTYSNQTMNVGTTRWMAPEIIRCLDFGSLVDSNALVVQHPFKCDVYSFAMVCYEILTGDIPFSNIHSPSEVKKMVLNGERPELLIQCPESLKNLIERCWSLNPSQRPKFGDICGELRHLQFILVSRPFVVRNIPPPPPLQARDKFFLGSKSCLANWLVRWDPGSKTRGSSSFMEPRIFDEKITASMLAFLNKEDAFPGCRIIAEGGGRTVYRVPLRDDLVVAIRRVRNFTEEEDLDGQIRYIRAELETVGFLRHPNLVSLLAYVYKTDFHFLVYDFTPGSSLEDALHRMAAGNLTLSWPERHRILCGVSQALQYLHSESLGSSIVHRDLSPANILLDEEYKAKISNLGLAAVVPLWATHNTTDSIAGTVGFIAPEFYQIMRYSQKTDVFSYGVVMAQLVTARNPTDPFVVENGSLGQWLHKCLQSSDGADEAIDPALQGSGFTAEILQALKIAVLCTNQDPKQRPTIAEVLKMLLQIRNLDTVPVKESFRAYNDRSDTPMLRQEANQERLVATVGTSNSKEHGSHEDMHGESDENIAKGCISMEHDRGDDNSQGRIPRSSGESLEREEDRRVPQRVPSFDTSTMGMGETRKTTQTSELHDHKQPVLETLSKYDVFLNHRGPDLKKTFVSHLADALRRAGLNPFLDAESLVKGEHAFNSINEALRGVHVHVAIFSPGYAESKYCLNELCDMLESQKPLIPVFYNVEPENLRWIEAGPFAKAFEEHLRKGRDVDVVKWKAALSQAAAITGFKLVDYNTDTVKLLEKIVAAVLKALPAPLPVARHPVGLIEVSTDVIDQLQKMGENVGVVGIYGVGGIGKTTLAREVYNREQSSFRSRCFLSDVKDCEGVGPSYMQMMMVTDLLHMDVKKVDWDFARWFGDIQKRKVLVVVDDISNKQQFDELIPDMKKLAPGSRVLITSRDRDVLRSIIMDISEGTLYQVPELSPADSLHLFLGCAFRRNSIEEVDACFHASIKKIIRACGGVPLALEVMGGFLAGKKHVLIAMRLLIEAISGLRISEDITKILHMSYDDLESDDDKHMFLDIACFMLGHPKEIAMEVWESSDDYAFAHWSLSRLIDKCLVKVDVDGNLRIHDLLRDMGRNIIMQKALCKLEMQSHIWDPSMASTILQKKEGSSKLLALSLLGVDHGIACNADVYAKFMELRYLLLDGIKVTGDFSRWSEELRWLRWRHCPHEELPWSLKFPNLAVLDLAQSDSLTHLWGRNFELKFCLGGLRTLMLSHCRKLAELPQDLNKLLKLRYLGLSGCVSLTELPKSLGDLVELELLDLSHCINLTRLPNSIMNLSKLKEIRVIDCMKLSEFPTKFGRLESLRMLKAGRSGLKELSETFGQLQSLEEADFCGCIGLQYLCEDFGRLGNLQKLSLEVCSSLIRLPESFLQLSNLEELKLSRCWQLERLPDFHSRLRKLKVLEMRNIGW